MQLLTLVSALLMYIVEQQFPNWSESLRNMTRKLQAEFIPTRVRKNTYGNPNPAGVFICNAPAMDTEEDCAHDMII